MRTNAINPAAVHTPFGYKRIKRGEPLRYGDMFLHVIDLKWMKCDDYFTINNFTNCIRPIRLIAEHCSYNDFR
jgi:hypothetical protein